MEDTFIDTEGPPDDEAAALEKAANRVAQYLKYPENLEKVEQYRLRTSRKKASVDARLKSTVQSQLDDVRHGLSLLARAVVEIEGIRKDIHTSEAQFSECSELVEHVDLARALSTSRSQLKSTMEQLDRIFNVPETVKSLESSLECDDPDLLRVHASIAGLEQSRAHLLQLMSDQDASTIRKGKAAVDSYFEGVTILSLKLQQQILYEGSDPLILVREAPRRLVSILRIVAREEKADAEAQPSDDARPKQLKRKLFEKIEMTLEQKFDSKLFLNSVPRFLQAFNSFYFEDLKIAKDELPSRCPPDYDIFNFYLNQYHERLCGMLDRLQNSNQIDPSEIMTLLNWVPDYSQMMKAKLGVDVSEFQNQLLGYDEDKMRETYLRMVTAKLGGWVTNLVATETQLWFSLEEQEMPSETSDGLFLSDTPVILFQMIDTQIEVAYQPGGGGDFAHQLLRQCMITMREFHSQYIEAMYRVKSQYLENNAERPELLVELMIVAANNNHRARVYIKQIVERVEEQLAPGSPEEAELKEELKNASQGFDKVAKFAVGILTDIVFADVASVADGLFIQKWMRSDTCLRTILVTIKDYCQDFRSHLEPGYCEQLMDELLRQLLVLYIQAMLTKRLKISSEDDRDAMCERILAEQQLIENLFQEFEIEVDEQDRDVGAVLTYIVQLLESSQGMVTISWLKMKHEYPDITLHHLEAILALRHDFKNKDARNYIKNEIVKKDDGDMQADEHMIVARGGDFFRRIAVSTSSKFGQAQKEQAD